MKYKLQTHLKSHTAYHVPLLRAPFRNKVLMYFVLCMLSAFCFLPSASAQRIEVHGIKDLSTNKTINKAWGVGGVIHLDQWVKKTTFCLHFDWTTYRPKDKATNPKFNRISGGVSAFYSFNLTNKITFQCGAEVNYTNLRHSYRYATEEIDPQTEKFLTVLQTGHFIGIGPLVGFDYALSPRFSVRVNFVPAYLISIGSKSSAPDVEAEYSKGMWVFPIQLGITYKLFNAD